MAVQAQYPSNVLFLNRNGQEGQDSSLQQHPGDFLDQSHMLLNNGGSNPRKRGREMIAPMNSHHFSLQSQPPQVIDLSLLHNQHHHPPPPTTPNVVSTGLRLSSGGEQAHNMNNRFQQYQQQERHHQYHLSSPSSSGFFSVLSEDVAAQIKRQRQEVDGFLHAQGEELRRTLAEKRQRHYRALLCALEEPLARKLRDKEAEVERATRRHEELEARAAQLAAEAQGWQARARAQEAAAASLQAQLQQAMMINTCGGAPAEHDSRVAEEGLMCAAGSGVEPGGGLATEDAESAYIDPDRVTATAATAAAPSCKACRRRAATVVLLPCRHLSLCTECDRVALACPLCLTLRNSSVEAVLC